MDVGGCARGSDDAAEQDEHRQREDREPVYLLEKDTGHGDEALRPREDQHEDDGGRRQPISDRNARHQHDERRDADQRPDLHLGHRSVPRLARDAGDDLGNELQAGQAEPDWHTGIDGPEGRSP